jgi:hypothetical protein
MWWANLKFSSNFFSRPLKFYSPEKLVHSFQKLDRFPLQTIAIGEEIWDSEST